MFERYLSNISSLISTIRDTQKESIKKAAQIIADSTLEGGALYAFGAGHSDMMASEITYRAGGFALANPIYYEGLMLNVKPVTKTTLAERTEGIGKIIMEGIQLTPKDTLLVASVSGRNAAPIEVAMVGKEQGAKLIVLTSLEYSNSVTSRHSSGKRLFELEPDVILDYCCPPGDATIKLEGFEQKIGPVSTICGHIILNSVIVEVVEILIEKGIDPLPIYMSANLDQGKAFNDKIMEAYKSRIRYL
ncbi:MAG TPA: hypothetical protein DCE14_07365 [Kosmotogaceae bacterium]|nr:hypothetical protein [Kosmotogaceae bacterium]